MFLNTPVEHQIKEFKKRIKTDGRKFCEELYHYATIRLLAHKWAYYVKSQFFVDDVAYDIEERSWFVMGRSLGYLSADETSPCIDFDPKHPLAKEAIKYAKTLKFR